MRTWSHCYTWRATVGAGVGYRTMGFGCGVTVGGWVGDGPIATTGIKKTLAQTKQKKAKRQKEKKKQTKKMNTATNLFSPVKNNV